MANLVVRGHVSEKMFIVSMIMAHAATKGNLQEKQAAGVGILKQYLGENSARQEAWQKASQLDPGQVIARASLSMADLEVAAKVIKAATDVEQRRMLLGQEISPHYPVLFGRPGESTAEKNITVEASELEEGLQPKLPAKELIMLDQPDGQGKISENQVTNEQYGIFIAQTGHREPYYERKNPNDSVFGVDYKTDAVAFTSWMGRTVPTEEKFLAAKEAGILQANKPWEWTAKNENGWQIERSLPRGHRRSHRPNFRSYYYRSFRVADG